MKNMKLMLFAVAAIAATSCAKEIAPEKPQTGMPELIPMTFTAGAEDVESKVALQQDGLTLHWEATDKISVFDGASNNQFTTTEAGASVDFTGGVTATADNYYALYPYQKDARFELDANADNRPTIYAEVPTVQTAVAGSVPSNAFIAVAKSVNTNYFNFSSICGYIKYTLNQDNVESITFSGNNNESITGPVKIYFNADGTANQTYVSGAMKPTVTLTGDLKNGETYYAAIRPTSFSKGLTVSILYKDGTRSYKTTNVAPSEGVRENVVMKFVAPPTYYTTVPSDNFLAYIHGYDLTIGSTTFNINDENALKYSLITAASTGTDLSGSISGNNKSGIYFLSQNANSNFLFNSTVILTSDIILVNRDSNSQVTISNSSNKYVALRGGSWYSKDISYTLNGGEGYLFNMTGNTTDPDTKAIVFEGCKIENIAGTFITFNDTEVVSKIEFNSCDIAFKSATDYKGFINSGQTQIFPQISFTNNIFYCTEDRPLGFVTAGNATVNDFSFVQNTIVKLYPNTSYQYYNNFKSVNKVSLGKNYFEVPKYKEYVVDKYCRIINAGTYPTAENITMQLPKGCCQYDATNGTANALKGFGGIITDNTADAQYNCGMNVSGISITIDWDKKTFVCSGGYGAVR